MRYNENTAIAGREVLLVPYEAHHVPQYHAWMEDAAIREATASDRLTLDEEYENQVSWRTSPDKLTFILCRARPSEPRAPADQAAVAGQDDVPERMVGDINLFLTPWEDDADADDGAGGGGAAASPGSEYVRAEVDVMIAGAADRGRGLGRAAVRALLCFVARHATGLLHEYAGAAGRDAAAGAPRALREFVARIQASNAGSIALFASLGFQQRGGVNYFGEVEMVRPASAEWDARARDVEGYCETEYDRSLLPAAAGP